MNTQDIKDSKNLNAPSKGNIPALRFSEFTDEWKKIRLGDNCSIQMCKRIMAAQTNTEGGVPFYKIGTIGGKADAYISKDLFDEYKRKYSYPNKGEVMITCAGTVGKCVIYDGEDSYYQDSNIVWIDNPNEIISNDFLYHLLSNINWSYLNSTTIVRIYNDDLRNLKLCCPRLDEQKKIARFLSLINERIATQNRIIEDLKKLKSALYQKIFGDLVAPTLKLVQLAEIAKGQQVNCTDLLEYGDYYVMNGGITPSGWLNRYNTEANTISISEGGNSCGYVQYNTSPYWSGGHCYSLRILHPQETLDLYLYHFLKWQENNIMALRIGSGLPNIQKKDLLRFPVILPTITQQNKIVSILSAIEEKVSCEISISKYFIKQKEYLLRQLFI